MNIGGCLTLVLGVFTQGDMGCFADIKRMRPLHRGSLWRRSLMLIRTHIQDTEKIKHMWLKPVKLKHWKNEVDLRGTASLTQIVHCAYWCNYRLEKEMQLWEWKLNKMRVENQRSVKNIDVNAKGKKMRKSKVECVNQTLQQRLKARQQKSKN